jgi:hypothetical protein
MVIFSAGTAMAQSCESQAVSAAGKPLHGAAKAASSAGGIPITARQCPPMEIHSAREKYFVVNCLHCDPTTQ